MSRVKAIVSKVNLITILGACLALSCARVGVPKSALEKGAAPFDPPAVYLTWLHDPTTTMTIQWHSNGGRDDDVQYQRLDERVWHTANGSHHPMPHSDRIVHVAELTGLKPGTDYRFRFKLGDDASCFSFLSLG